MDLTETRYELIGQHQHSFERKPSAAVIEEILQIWAQELEYQSPELAVVAEPVHLWYTRATTELLVDVSFDLELARAALRVFELDGNIPFRDEVDG